MRTPHLAAVLALLLSARAAPAVAADLKELASGQKAPDIQLPVATTAEGKRLALADELKKNKLTVVMFISTQCPVSNAYNGRMAQLAKDYAQKGVGFVGVNSNRAEAAAEIAEHAKKNGFAFPVVKDDKNLVADSYGARVTPEIFVVDPSGTIRYHGRIDEKKDAQKPEEIQSPDLRRALDALLGGKAPDAADTKAFGCSIKRVPG